MMWNSAADQACGIGRHGFGAILCYRRDTSENGLTRWNVSVSNAKHTDTPCDINIRKCSRQELGIGKNRSGRDPGDFSWLSRTGSDAAFLWRSLVRKTTIWQSHEG
jgi:hypothetical protein